MKNLLLILFLLSQVIHAQDAFEKANALYRNDRYAEAAEIYENILRTKTHSPEVYFNLGNAYYKMNKVAPAIYNFEKALLLSPNDREIRNNLGFAHKMMIDEVRDVPKAGFGKLVADFTSAFHYNTWAWISIVFSVIFLLFFVGYYFSGIATYKRIFFIGMFVWVVFVILSVTAALFERNRFNTERPAIIFDGIVAVKSEPKSNAPDVITLHEGTKVYVLDKLDNWRKVQLPDGNDGWIESKAIKEVKQ